MKHLILLFVLFLGMAQITQAQCGSQPFFQQGRKILFTTTMGQRVVKVTYTVKSVTNQSGGEVAAFDIQTDGPGQPGNDGKPHSSATITSATCTGSSVVLSITIPFPGNTSVTMVQDYPLNMQVGDNLKDVATSGPIHFSTSDTKQMTMTMHRKVVAQESVTTPASTWSCYKIAITTHTEITGMQMPAGTGDSQSFQWFCPSIGVVKTSSSGGGIDVTSVLTSIQ